MTPLAARAVKFAQVYGGCDPEMLAVVLLEFAASVDHYGYNELRSAAEELSREAS